MLRLFIIAIAIIAVLGISFKPTDASAHWRGGWGWGVGAGFLAGALEKGVDRAVKTLKNVEGAWVKEQKVVVKNGKISEYRVDLKVTFILVD